MYVLKNRRDKWREYSLDLYVHVHVLVQLCEIVFMYVYARIASPSVYETLTNYDSSSSIPFLC